MEEINRDFPTYYDGYVGNGESLREIAKRLAAANGGLTKPIPAPIRAKSSGTEAVVKHPIYYDGSMG
ncbi:hypothetical protein [Paenibacillus sacheonensis]|uniref:Uncharacterized protein n=1 Tax=Paenibacillus sacheonensis TaxID=742054 RepID=A0A7X5BX82_9BACL|nr:hypothetical protein [Paenibacillus sacheonensis]MBM7563122.1 hypothetical protein [Paenibacillus sacheonensis]NBC68312.1 hypothetical protein [Paenibacillus sacheonensis]